MEGHSLGLDQDSPSLVVDVKTLAPPPPSPQNPPNPPENSPSPPPQQFAAENENNFAFVIQKELTWYDVEKSLLSLPNGQILNHYFLYPIQWEELKNNKSIGVFVRNTEGGQFYKISDLKPNFNKRHYIFFFISIYTHICRKKLVLLFSHICYL